ncbi:MAG: hypothetical protein AAGA18_09965 [Verrucomicrobiota bacterium]
MNTFPNVHSNTSGRGLVMYENHAKLRHLLVSDSVVNNGSQVFV